MQPLIEPLYEGRSAHDFLAAFTAQPGAPRPGDRQGFLDEDLQQRRRRLDVQESARRELRECRRVLARGAARWFHRRHEPHGRRAGHDADGAREPALPQRPGPQPRHQPRQASSRQRRLQHSPRKRLHPRRLRRLRLRRRSTATAPAAAAASKSSSAPIRTIWDGRFANNGWLQELPKPYTKVTWDPTAWISTRLAEERGLREGDVVELKLSRQHRAHAGVRRPRASGAVGDGVLRLRPQPRRPRRQCGWRVAAVQRVPAAHLGCAVVRQRPRAREDRRQLSAGDHAGASLDGGPRAGPHRVARGVHQDAADHPRAGRTPRRAR